MIICLEGFQPVKDGRDDNIIRLCNWGPRAEEAMEIVDAEKIISLIHHSGNHLFTNRSR